jgi:hypothetical protein
MTKYYPSPADIRSQVESHLISAGWDKDPPWVKRSQDGRFSESGGGGSSKSASSNAKGEYNSRRTDEIVGTEHKKASAKIKKYGELAAAAGMAALGVAIAKKTGVKQIKELAKDYKNLKGFRKNMEDLAKIHKLPPDTKPEKIRGQIEAALKNFESERDAAISLAKKHMNSSEGLREEGMHGSARQMQLHAQYAVNESNYWATRIATQKAKLHTMDVTEIGARQAMGDIAKNTAIAGAALAAVSASFGAATRLAQEGVRSDD